MEWSSLYCPNQRCSFYGCPWPDSRLVKNGRGHGVPQALCRACGSIVNLRYGTAYADLQAPPAQFALAVRALAEGNSLRATGRIVGIDKDTAAAWLDRAAHQARRVMLSLWRELPVTECQLDELWSFVHTKEDNLATAQVCCATYGDAWVWVAFAPAWRLVRAFVIGKRTQAAANLLLERVAHVTTGAIPFFTSDQLSAYATALLHVYGQWQQPLRRGTRGRQPLPRRVPPPDLLYAQVVKQRERGRVVAVTTKVVFGAVEQVVACLEASAVSQTINTSFVERQNLDLRQHSRRLTRKTNGFSKELPWLEKQLWLALAYYHLVLPQESLRHEVRLPELTRGSGSRRRWQPRTPAMVAGITDHVWSMEELLGYRVPAAFLDTLEQWTHLFPPLEVVHQLS